MRTRRLALLGAAVLVCLLLLTLQSRGHNSRAADVLAVITTPVQTLLSKAHRTTFGLWSRAPSGLRTRAST